MLKEWFRRALGRGSKDADVERKLGQYLTDSESCTLLRLILENPGISTATLVGRAHMDKVATATCLEKLAGDGIIISEGAGYHIAADAKAAVVKHLPLNYQCPGMLRE